MARNADMHQDSPRGFHESGRQPSTDADGFLRHGYDVVVDNAEGYLCKLRLKALVNLRCQEVFAVFSNPDNSGVFRSIDKVLTHKVEHEGEHEHVVYVEQTASVGFLWFRRQFITALRVTHNEKELATSFQLAKPGMMAKFQGHWTLTPVDAEGYASLRAKRLDKSEPRPMLESEACLMYLEQDVAPAITDKVPPMFHGLLRRISKAAIVSLVQDINTVADLRMAGLPLETILQGPVHGRAGLKARYLQQGGKSELPAVVAAPHSASSWNVDGLLQDCEALSSAKQNNVKSFHISDLNDEEVES